MRLAAAHMFWCLKPCLPLPGTVVIVVSVVIVVAGLVEVVAGAVVSSLVTVVMVPTTQYSSPPITSEHFALGFKDWKVATSSPQVAAMLSHVLPFAATVEKLQVTETLCAERRAGSPAKLRRSRCIMVMAEMCT